MRASIAYGVGLLLTLYCSSGSTQSYLKYNIPLSPSHKLYDSEIRCLQKALYFESRSLNDRSMALVGVTTLNRANSPSGGPTICETVHKKVVIKQTGKISCDYSWYCDGKSDRMLNLVQKGRALRIAKSILNGKYSALTHATHFVHKDVVKSNSKWLKNMKALGCDSAHCFYMNKPKR